MTIVRSFSRLSNDSRGAVAVEFGILAPLLIMLLMGVLMIGIYMKSYNSVRSVAYDVNRYTVIEYQKENRLDGTQIAQVTSALARRAPYNLAADNIDAAVEEVESGITGAKKYELTVTYTPPAISGILGIHPPKIVQTESIIVPD